MTNHIIIVITINNVKLQIKIHIGFFIVSEIKYKYYKKYSFYIIRFYFSLHFSYFVMYFCQFYYFYIYISI